MKTPAIYAFIDSQNLNLSIKSCGWELDFNRFRVYLKEKYHVTKAHLFLGYLKERKKMYESLTKMGYSLISKPATGYTKGNQKITKGNIDADMVLHTMLTYDDYEKAVIVTGDGDFYSLVKELRKKNKLKRLLIPNRASYSKLFGEFIKDIDFINGLKVKLGMRG